MAELFTPTDVRAGGWRWTADRRHERGDAGSSPAPTAT